MSVCAGMALALASFLWLVVGVTATVAAVWALVARPAAKAKVSRPYAYWYDDKPIPKGVKRMTEEGTPQTHAADNARPRAATSVAPRVGGGGATPRSPPQCRAMKMPPLADD